MTEQEKQTEYLRKISDNVTFFFYLTLISLIGSAFLIALNFR